MNQIFSSKLVLPFSVVAIVLVLAVGGVFLLNQNPEQQPTPNSSPSPTPTPTQTPTPQPVAEVTDERIVTNLIEALPDIKLLRGIPLQEGAEGLTTRVVERPQNDSPYFVVEVWEDLSGEFSLFQRYRYDSIRHELLIDLPLNPTKGDRFTRSVLDVEIGKIIAVIDLGRSDLDEEGHGRQECATGSQMVLNFCAGRARLWTDQMLSIVYNRILSDRTISKESKNSLIEMQEMWFQEKQSKCKYEEGSIASSLEGICKEKMNRERIERILNTYLK